MQSEEQLNIECFVKIKKLSFIKCSKNMQSRNA